MRRHGDAQPREVPGHSSRERHHSRQEESDRHARRRHSAERHRHERSRSRHRDSDRHYRAPSGRNDRERSPVRDRARVKVPVERGRDRRQEYSYRRDRNDSPRDAVRPSSGRPGHQASPRLRKAHSPARRREDDIIKGDIPAKRAAHHFDHTLPRVKVEPQSASAAVQLDYVQHLPPHLPRRSGASPGSRLDTADRVSHTDRAPYSEGLYFRGVPIHRAEDPSRHFFRLPSHTEL